MFALQVLGHMKTILVIVLGIVVFKVWATVMLWYLHSLSALTAAIFSLL